MKDYNKQYEKTYNARHAYDIPEQYREDIKKIKAFAGTFASTIIDIVPDGREKSMALTKLEEVMFWANAGIARGEK